LLVAGILVTMYRMQDCQCKWKVERVIDSIGVTSARSPRLVTSSFIVRIDQHSDSGSSIDNEHRRLNQVSQAELTGDCESETDFSLTGSITSVECGEQVLNDRTSQTPLHRTQDNGSPDLRIELWFQRHPHTEHSP